jgi:hypothetical protein
MRPHVLRPLFVASLLCRVHALIPAGRTGTAARAKRGSAVWGTSETIWTSETISAGCDHDHDGAPEHQQQQGHPRPRRRQRLRSLGVKIAGAGVMFGRPLVSRAQSAKLAVSLDKPLRFGDVSQIDRSAISK